MTIIRDYLQLFRAQTYPASLMLLFIFYFLGGGRLLSWQSLGLAIYALVSHYIGFGHNSLMDSCKVPKIGELPYDAQDSNKAHHPLIDGRISLDTAHIVIHSGMMLGVLLALFLILGSGGNRFWALTCLTLYYVFGQAYNDGLNKTTVHSYLVISTCYVFYGLFAFFLTSDKLITPAILLCIYVFLVEIFQNNVEGALKELKQVSEKNTMRKLGCYVKGDGTIIVSCKGIAFGFSIKILSVITLAFLISEYPLNKFGVVLLFAFITFILWGAGEILTNTPSERKELIKLFSLEEILSIYAPYFILAPILGWEILFLLPLGVLYFVLLNRINWGTWLSPAV